MNTLISLKFRDYGAFTLGLKTTLWEHCNKALKWSSGVSYRVKKNLQWGKITLIRATPKHSAAQGLLNILVLWPCVKPVTHLGGFVLRRTAMVECVTIFWYLKRA